jgi:hypothetical protein
MPKILVTFTRYERTGGSCDTVPLFYFHSSSAWCPLGLNKTAAVPPQLQLTTMKTLPWKMLNHDTLTA